jgi:hypothetical protein
MSKKRVRPLDPAVLGRLNEDNWKPRKKKAEGDHRHYLRTNKGTAPGLPQDDESDPRVVWWFSKRIYLGGKPKARYLAGKTPPERTRLWKLFDVLVYPPDRWHSVSEIHERVFGSSLDGAPRAERERAVLRIRRLVSKLKRRMAQCRADEHAILIATSCNRQPGYMALLLSNQKYEKGQEPWPKLRRTDREDRRSLKEDRQENGEPIGVVYWGDKSIRLGEITCLRKLFHLLADHPGRWRPVSRIEDFVFGTNCDTSVGVSEEEMSKTQQKLRRLISRLNDRMQEAGLGDETIIVPHSYQGQPGYFLLLIPDQKHGGGHGPQPKAQTK